MKISQPLESSQSCVYSEIEVYPVSVQWNFVLTTAVRRYFDYYAYLKS